VTDFAGRAWAASRGARLEPGADLRYETSGAQGMPAVRARQPGASSALPAVVSPALAAEAGPDGILPLRLGTGEPLRVSVARVADDFPTAGGASRSSTSGACTPRSTPTGRAW
jgi:hypothetical protein